MTFSDLSRPNNPQSRPNSQAPYLININHTDWNQIIGRPPCCDYVDLSYPESESWCLGACLHSLCPSSAELRPLANTAGLQLMVAARPASGGGALPAQSLQRQVSCIAETSHANIQEISSFKGRILGKSDKPTRCVVFLTGWTWKHCLLHRFNNFPPVYSLMTLRSYEYLFPLTPDN